MNEYIRKTNTRILAELLRILRACLRQRIIAAGNATNSKVCQTTLPLPPPPQKKTTWQQEFFPVYGRFGRKRVDVIKGAYDKAVQQYTEKATPR